MATMFPESVQRFHTQGEELVYRWLEQMAKPDADFLVWYTPDAQDLEPDFLLYHDSVGLVVLEVKDWALNQILSADPQSFRLQMGGKEETFRNPLRQAREYQHAVMETLKKDHRLLSQDPAYRDKPKIPLSHGVVFPNINRQEFLDHGLAPVVSDDQVFFYDDLCSASAYWSRPPGRAFAEDLVRRFPPLFPCQLSNQEKFFLKGVLFPQAQVHLPKREGGTPEYQAEAQRLRLLDHNQEVIARKWDGGHRLIVGPSGSGKTLVLAHKAAYLHKYDPSVTSVLFICYNMTLVRYIRRLLAELGTPLGPGGVEVVHFFELCSRILEGPIDFERQPPDYYDLVVEMALARAPECGRHYDAILVDEGQDLSDDMVRVIVALLNPETGNLTIALDEAQDIYRRQRSSWKELGVQARGRTMPLRSAYRNSRAITAFAAGFAQGAPANGSPTEATTASGQLQLGDDQFAAFGPDPQVQRFKTFDEALASVGPEIRRLQAECGYPLSEFAVLYPRRVRRGDTDIDLPLRIQAALDSAGVLWRWASKNSQSKSDYDIAADSVTISTIHSVKGLDFACAFLVGFDFLEPGPHWREEQLNSLVYVAITRARTRLYVPYAEDGWAVRRMLGQLPEERLG